MDIIYVLPPIPLIADQVLPISALPDRSLTFVLARLGSGVIPRSGPTSDEIALDQPPAGGVIGVAVRQAPDHVHVVRQDDSRLDLEGAPRLDHLNCPAQQSDRLLVGEDLPAVESDHGEEKAAAGGSDATVFYG